MRTLIVISDTHGNTKAVESLRALIAENDYLVHLGDGVGDVRAVMHDYPNKVYLCAGNCDFFSPLHSEGILEIEKVRILYCHGHKYRVKSSLQELATQAKKRGCEIALYGHTHKPLISEIDGVTLVNPGSLRYETGKGGSYCYLVVHGEKITPVLVGETPQ